jgi:hypothetical protein
MMKRMSNTTMCVLSLFVALGLTWSLEYTLGAAWNLYAVASVIPVLVHWFLFVFHAWPRQTEKLFDLGKYQQVK